MLLIDFFLLSFFSFIFSFLTLIQSLLNKVSGCAVQQLLVNNGLMKGFIPTAQKGNSFDDGGLQKYF